MPVSFTDDDPLMMSYVDQRVGFDAMARLIQHDPAAAPGPAAGTEFTLVPFDDGWAAETGPVVGYGIPHVPSVWLN